MEQPPYRVFTYAGGVASVYSSEILNIFPKLSAISRLDKGGTPGYNEDKRGHCYL